MDGSPSSRRLAPRRSVLVVDDDPTLRKLVTSWLERAGLPCIEVGSGRQALDHVRQDPEAVEALVLDVMMPDLDGFETLRQLQEAPETAQIPVLLLTAHATSDVDFVRSAEGGAVDHLAKPFSGPVLVARVRGAIQRGRATRDLRRQLVIAEERAKTDALTSLPNRREFERHLRRAVSLTTRSKIPLAVALLDIDHFKRINDEFGHDVGDLVLVHFARLARDVLRGEDITFRYGGEEFALLFPAATSVEAHLAVDRFRRALAESPVALEAANVPVTFSAGIASAEQQNDYDVDELMGRADAALYAAKRDGRNRVVRESRRPSPG